MSNYYVDKFYDGYQDLWGVFLGDELVAEFFLERLANEFCDHLNENDY